MARFLFVWMIMIGAMIGMREGTHFEVDVWPALLARAARRCACVASVFVLVFAAGLPLVRASSSRASPGTASPSWPSCRCG